MFYIFCSFPIYDKLVKIWYKFEVYGDVFYELQLTMVLETFVIIKINISESDMAFVQLIVIIFWKFSVRRFFFITHPFIVHFSSFLFFSF